MFKRLTGVIDCLKSQTLATEDEASAQGPSTCPANESGAEHVAFAEVLAVAIHIKYLRHSTSPYAWRRNIRIPPYPIYSVSQHLAQERFAIGTRSDSHKQPVCLATGE